MPIEREVGGVTVGRGVDGVVQESLAVGHVGLGCGVVVGGQSLEECIFGTGGA
jgi:hypothetical protein